ncbi:MAG: DUF4329 domain-containing protein [Acidiferrobacterales bacterium]|nr:DUF4329 domain-containing protein [Acidiferrobacterales bacterium]
MVTVVSGLVSLFGPPAIAKDALKECPYPSQHEAAAAILNQYNPISIANNVEYGGYIHRLAPGQYCFSKTLSGGMGHLEFGKTAWHTPEGTTTTATWHTHGAAVEGVISEIFSPQDINLNQRKELDGYLGTPSGAFKYLPLHSKHTQNLGKIATE